MKIFFGGSFDPVHNGHLALALQIAREFQHPVSFMPLNGNPNYKAPPQASLNDRLAMLEQLIADYPEQLAIDRHEAQLAEYTPTFYSLTRLRKIYGDAEPFYFVIGSDSLVNLSIWDCWQQLFGLTNFIVARRPDYPLEMMNAELAAAVLPRIATFEGLPIASGKIYNSDIVPMEISSTMIRQRIKAAQSIDDLVNCKVSNYIYNHNLYQGN